MWCHSCRQDVPGLPSGLDRHYACARCGTVMLLPAGETATAVRIDAAHAGEPEAPALPASPAPLLMMDLWELGQQLRHVERVLGAGGLSNDALDRTAELDGMAAEAPRQTVSAPGGPPRRRALRRKPDNSARRHRVDGPHFRPSAAKAQDEPSRSLGALLLAALSWILLSVGLSAFTCGAVLCTWGLLDARDDLWNIGLPILLFSQAALLIGLVLQLDSRGTAKAGSAEENEAGRSELPTRGPSARRKRRRSRSTSTHAS